MSRLGVVDDRGQRPDYGVCVVLLKYLLKCPPQVPTERDRVSCRDFKDADQTQDQGLSTYASTAISKRYAGRPSQLKTAVEILGGRPPENDYPCDLAAVLQALPRVPALFLFNDADEQFKAQASILYQRRA